MITTGKGVVNGYVFQVASHAALDDPATKAALEDYLARIAQAQVWSQTHQEEWAKVWAEETGLSRGHHARRRRRSARSSWSRSPTTVIDSEQEMADAFAENGLLPEQFDVAPFFSDEFNADTHREVT